MNFSELYQERLNQLDWLDYDLAKKVAANRGEPEKARQIYSSIKQALGAPERSSLKLNGEITQALGGVIHIQWEEQKKC
jgi:hypothetical protein